MSISSIAKKVVNNIPKYLGIGKKVTAGVSSIAHKVATGAGVVAGGAAALGLEPVAAGLGAVAGTAKGVELGANALGAGLEKAEKLSGALRSGIERVKGAEKEGGMMGKIDMGKAAYDTLKSVRGIMRP
jgi:hypothetical protein